MTSGKQPPKDGQRIPKSEDEEPREGGAVEEKREMMTRQIMSGGVETEGLDARLQAQIGSKLKAMFEEVAAEPVPDKFIELLKKLDAQGGGTK